MLRILFFVCKTEISLKVELFTTVSKVTLAGAIKGIELIQ